MKSPNVFWRIFGWAVVCAVALVIVGFLVRSLSVTAF